jgi:hypothetical protein
MDLGDNDVDVEHGWQIGSQAGQLAKRWDEQEARLRPLLEVRRSWALAQFGLPDVASRSLRRLGEVWRRGESNPLPAPT